jgi:glycosyl transferase, family 25
MRSYIIHMPSSTARRPNAERLLSTLPQAELVEAVDGRDPAHAWGVPVLQGIHLTPPYPFGLLAGEIGCFLSHRKCWQRIAEGPDDYALIAEDDLTVTPGDWDAAMDLVDAHANADSFIRLPAKVRERPMAVLAREGKARLILPRVVGLQTVAQVVGRNAARRLLEASEIIDRPVDTFLQMHWVTGQRMLTILPNGVSEAAAQTGGSTIQRKTRTSGKLMREFRRAVYRAQVGRRPQRPQEGTLAVRR